MGSKAKSWFLIPQENASELLFKRPQRENSGEHWAERIAAEVAKFLGIPHARVELAEYQDNHGSIAENIVPLSFALIHGNEVLESIGPSLATEELNFHLSGHTMENIWLALDRTLESDIDRWEAKNQFAEYLVLDAVIGNTDKHSENWGVLQRQDSSHRVESLAPSYDHGSSLGHELMEDQRKRFLDDGRVGNYVERGHGQIHWRRDDRHGPSPLELVRLAISQQPDTFHSATAKLDSLDDSALQGFVNAVPGDWMAPSARMFAFELMRYSCGQLKEVKEAI